MIKKNIKVSGNHINELSENIPSNIFALNELIKNSYDACATYCEIEIDPSNSQIVVRDNGKGLSEKNIDELFHLSRSSKKFGKMQRCGRFNRRVQGSKGLGFLAAFRFGHYVTWDTVSSGSRYVFSADKKILTQLDDLGEYDIQVDASKSTSKGTNIYINSNEPIMHELLSYFSNKTNHLKLVGAFIDDNFEVILKLPRETHKTNSIPAVKDVNPNDQLFYVRYSSIAKEIEIYRNGYLEKTIAAALSSKEYDVHLELMVYSLESHGRKKISPYFYRPNDSAITPLTFINDNLFNNYSLFDTDIFRSRRSKSALPQIIGYVKIYSESNSFEFNSDRTNFVENPVTNSLSSDLLNLNEIIQSAGSELKSIAKKNNSNYTGPAFPKKSLSNKNKPLVRAKIELSYTEKIITIPSKQIDLLDFVESISDSNGNPISNSDLEFLVDNKQSKNILSSVTEPCKKVVTYKFTDPNTGDVVEKLVIDFKEKKAPLTNSGHSADLFYILGSSKSYSIQIKNVAKLMDQISDANKTHKYYFLIACSLRTIFELSSHAVQANRPKVFTHDFKELNVKYGTTKQVVQVVHFLSNNDKIMTEVAKILGLSFSNLKKMLKVKEFQQKFEDSNVGAHSGEQYLTVSVIQDIAKLAGYYAAFCDVLVYHISDEMVDKSSIVDL